MKILTYEVAVKLAELELAKFSRGIGVPVEFAFDQTIESRLAWVFFYNGSAMIRDGDESYSLVGNGPIVVFKDGSGVFAHGSLPPLDQILKTLE